jgi:hypothetical protein
MEMKITDIKLRAGNEPLAQLVRLVDIVLFEIRNKIDAIQPRLSGRIQIEFMDKNNTGELQPQAVILKRNFKEEKFYWEKVPSEYLSARVKRDKDFNHCADRMVILLKEASELLATRKSIVKKMNNIAIMENNLTEHHKVALKEKLLRIQSV